MLRKICITGSLIAATAGTLLTASAASAQPMGGWGHFRHRLGVSTRSGNWSGNDNVVRNRIHVRIRNRNNNVAVARNEQRQRQRQWQRQRQRERQWLFEDPQLTGVATAEQCIAGGGQVFTGLPTVVCVGGTFAGFRVIG